MSSLLHKERFLRVLPGRIRIEICGLQGSRETAEKLTSAFSGRKGMIKAEANTLTGRLLLLYDEKRIGMDEIFRLIRLVEQPEVAPQVSEPPAEEPSIAEETFIKEPSIEKPSTEMDAAMREAAVTGIVEPQIPDDIRIVPQHKPPKAKGTADKIPLPLALSMGGLAVLGVKQLFMGRSALAASPVPFYMSAAVSVMTGYPFIKRGIQSYSSKKRINMDLLLGTGALALALVRENLVVLAGLSILQYVNWKRSSQIKQEQLIKLSPEIEAYSEKAGKWGMAAAAATWALTRNPLRAIAVLLAANPRPMVLPAQCAWTQAEVVSGERNYVVPEKGSLSRLARTKTIIVEDSALLYEHSAVEDLECIANSDGDADKLVCFAASLLEKSSHPWKEEIWDKAKQTCRTIRTAFHVTEEEQGIKGKINDTWILLGSCKYLQEHGIDCSAYELKAKRWTKKGSGVLCVAKLERGSNECLGALVRHQENPVNHYGRIAASFAEQGWKVAVWQNSLNLNGTALARNKLDTSWMSLEQGEVLEKIAVMQHQGEEVLFVSDREQTPWNYLVREAGVPSISVEELEGLADSIVLAESMEQTVNRHAQITKKWNLLGSALATMGILSAPVINLAADALSLVFMSRTKRISEGFPPNPSRRVQAEIAAAAETPVWHTMPIDNITGGFQVHPQSGLSSEQVRTLRNRYGPNRLESKQPTPWLVSYLGQFKEFTTLVLLGTSVLALFTGGLFDGLAMGAILFANAAVGTFQERKAEKVVDMLNQFQPPACKCIRDGELTEMSADQLVPGDIVSLEAGDRVPADIRLLHTWSLRVNEAALTGESLPVEKNEADLTEDCPLSDRSNMLYMGTDVCGGKGTGIVVHTGMNTEIGHLMSLMKKQDKEMTPLQEKVTSISKKFVKGALVAGGLVFAVGMLRGVPFTTMLSTSITLAASAIPEGLPVTITIALSAGIYRMAKKQALLRRLSSLETLGRTTVICSDKTGTLTRNEMTVKVLSTAAHTWTVTGDGYSPDGKLLESDPEVAATAVASVQPETTSGGFDDHPDLQRLIQICILCNNSKLEQADGQWTVKGDPTEGALLTLAAKSGLRDQDMSHWHRGLEIPFDSDTAKMSVVCKDTRLEQDCYLFSKGAVETILRHCSRYQKDGGIYLLSEEQKQRILQQNEAYSAEALRVLAFAYRPVDEQAGEAGIDEHNLIYVGLAGMMDPPKQDVHTSISEALALGVKPVMITGDHPVTAIAVAKQLGIYNSGEQVLSGYELERMSDDDLEQVVDQVSIFARVAPEHKLRIVTAYQNRGHIVAMTGDGVNDTPAIKQADVGIAMGRSGTEVTKETADMVLTGDHFGAIVDGIKEGRTIMGNIRKALGCLLTGNLAEILVTSAAVAAGLPIPLAPIQILLMNLLTDALPAMILAVNPGNKTNCSKRTDIVDKELYQKVVTKGLLLGAGSFGLFAACMAAGVPAPVAQSTAFAALVAGQLIQTFSWRQEGSEESVRDWSKDRFLLGALSLSWLALLAVLYVPPLAGFFHTAPIPFKLWIPILGIAGSVSLLSKPLLALISRKRDLRPVQSLNQAALAAV